MKTATPEEAVSLASGAEEGADERANEGADERAEPLAGPIARAILTGFDRHYALFRYNAQQAKGRFDAGDWHGIQRLARERITFYDLRVAEAVNRIEYEFRSEELGEQAWQQVRREFVALLAEHKQPELAETFFNSVSTKILHRSYFHNAFIFVRPAVATEYLDGDSPVYRAYYPQAVGLETSLRQVLIDFGLSCPFADVEHDIALVRQAVIDTFPGGWLPATDCQIHVLKSLFFRNKGAYLIGRFVNDGEITPFSIPILRDEDGRLFLDALLFGTERIETLFNFSRAYFMVDMSVPSAYVQFLRTLMPTKPDSELYSMVGLHKQGKTLFYRDMMQHLKHSTDQFIEAPGIKGLVMMVFTLPSFPYVFKIIRDKRRKDMTREFIQSQYQLVKLHDRVGRMSDTWEYSGVPFPRNRLHPDLLAALREELPSILEDDGDNLVIRHLYIERRMVPLNIYLETATGPEREHAILEYGLAIKEMVGANIFPGDMLYKNFGVTRQGRVVFYDYDEVAYTTDCNFRRIPPPRTPEDEMAAEPWYSVGPNDVFPEEFGTFLLGNRDVRDLFMRHHADLLEPEFWQAKQQRIRDGILEDVFPYPESVRFDRGRDTIPKQAAASPSDTPGASTQGLPHPNPQGDEP